jgi:hypothetical protein
MAMIIHQYVSKAVQDDAPRAGERDRLLLEARRARMPRPKRQVFAAPAERLARLLRLAPAKYSKTPRDLEVRPLLPDADVPAVDSTEASTRAYVTVR